MKRFKDLQIGDYLFFRGGGYEKINDIKKENGHLMIATDDGWQRYYIPLNHLNANKLTVKSSCDLVIYLSMKSCHRNDVKTLEKKYSELKQLINK